MKKYRIKQSSHGKYFIQVKGWFFWSEMGNWVAPHRFGFVIKYYDTLKEAEEVVKLWRSPAWIKSHQEKVMKTYD